jgi:voltage-gated potassium channel
MLRIADFSLSRASVSHFGTAFDAFGVAAGSVVIAALLRVVAGILRRWVKRHREAAVQSPPFTDRSAAMQSEDRLRRIEEATDLPLLLLAVAMIPLLLSPYLFSPSAGIETAMLTADWIIWAVFAVDFGAKVAVAPRRAHYVRTHWLEAAMVVLPFLRPLRALRVLRVLRLARVGVAIGLNVTLLRRIASHRGLHLTVAAVVVIGGMGALVVLLAERDAESGNIRNYGDALWWAATTMTTVGYGDRFPTTPAGRGVAVALMLVGIAALSSLTATIAALLVQEREVEEEVSLQDLRDEIRQLRAALEAREAGGV